MQFGRDSCEEEAGMATSIILGRAWLVGISSAVLIALAVQGPCFAEDHAAAFAAAKKQILLKTHSKVAAERVSGMQELGKYPVPDAAELLLKFGLVDREVEVRAAARAAMGEYKDHPEIAQRLLDLLKVTGRKQGLTVATANLLIAQGAFESEEIDTTITKYLDEVLANTKTDPNAPFDLIDELGNEQDAMARRTLFRLARSHYFQSNYAYRRAIVQALSKIRQPEVVDAFVNLLPLAQGQVQFDIIKALTQFTGQKFKDDNRAWSAWWNTAAQGYQLPETSDIVLDIDPAAVYYGIPICAKRVEFILDTSGSMRGEPIAAAKRTLAETIMKLPESVEFNVVFFNRDVSYWKQGLVPATASNRHQAKLAVEEATLGRLTASNKALHAAFANMPEAIYFLSDGAPTDAQPREIVEAITRLNHTRRVCLHTIGIGTDKAETESLGLFMQALSGPNWGEYRAVGF
jgi:von Willebrand factor type A domain